MRYATLLEAKDKIELIPLPYDMGALAPVMSRDTVKYHYSVLSKGYVDRYNKGEGDKQFNRAGALLHNLWWPQLQAPQTRNTPQGPVADLIRDHYDDFVDFKRQFTEAATAFMGSGWIYLAKDGKIKDLKNQSWKNDVLLPIDMWEHSYYMDYPADKKTYLKNIWSLINWKIINERI